MNKEPETDKISHIRDQVMNILELYQVSDAVNACAIAILCLIDKYPADQKTGIVEGLHDLLIKSIGNIEEQDKLARN
jgi:hypothetical protein